MSTGSRDHNKEIRIVLLGFGLMGRTHFDRLQLNPYSTVSSIYVRSPEKYRQSYPHIQHLFTGQLERCVAKDVDAVDICLPTFLHDTAIQTCVSYGKHILVEKPIALSNHEADGIAQILTRSELILVVGHVLRFWPEFQTAKAMVEDGILGKPLSLSTVRRQGMPRWSSGGWIVDPQKSSGGVVDLQIHDIDFARWLFGEPIRLVSMGHRYRTGSWEHVSTMLKFADGVHANLHASNLLPEGSPFNASFRLYFEDGVLDYDSLSERGLVVTRAQGKREVIRVADDDPYQKEIDHFVDCVRANKKSEIISVEESLRALRIALESLDSLESDSERTLDRR